MEHEFWIFRDPVRMGFADGQHECYLRIPWRPARSDSITLACGASHRPDRSANYREHERPHLEQAWKKETVFFNRRLAGLHCAGLYAQLFCFMDGSRSVMDP